MKQTEFTCDLCVAAIDEHRHGFAIRWANSKIELRGNLDDSDRHLCIMCIDNLLYASEKFAKLIPFYREWRSADDDVAYAVMRERLACAEIAATYAKETEYSLNGLTPKIAMAVKDAILARTPSVATSDKKD